MIEPTNKNHKKLNIMSSIYLREYCDDLPIYDWIKRNKIGESEYGKYLDLLGRQEQVFHHRLFGHHPVYDMPFENPEKIPDFIEHVWISDSGTKQGLPIIPGEFLKDTNVLKYFANQSPNWNFVNAFDLLSGTLAIYAGYKNCERYFNEIDSIESFSELAKEIGIGTLELALAVNNANPFLLVGAIFHLVGTLKGLVNDSSKIYFKQIHSEYHIMVLDPHLYINDVVNSYYLQEKNLPNELSENTKTYYLK